MVKVQNFGEEILLAVGNQLVINPFTPVKTKWHL